MGSYKYKRLVQLIQSLPNKSNVKDVLEFVDVHFKDIDGDLIMPHVSLGAINCSITLFWRMGNDVIDIGFPFDPGNPRKYSYYAYINGVNTHADDLSIDEKLPDGVLAALVTSDDLYLVFRTGINHQDVWGVYKTPEAAIAAMKRAKEAENDDYHDFEIRVYKMGLDVKHDERAIDKQTTGSRFVNYYPDKI